MGSGFGWNPFSTKIIVMKKEDKLPNLQIEGIYKMNLEEMRSVKGGGFLSIGSACGFGMKRCRRRGGRLYTKSWGEPYKGECSDDDILN